MRNVCHETNILQKKDDPAWRKSRIHINQQDMIKLGALIDRYRGELEQVQREKDQTSTDKQNVRLYSFLSHILLISQARLLRPPLLKKKMFALVQ